jgi:hypothetical protein
VLCKLLPALIKEHNVHFTIANGENSAGGLGITPTTAKEIFSAGVDVITTGNHVFKQKQILSTLDKDPRILRPVNYPETQPGIGWTVIEKGVHKYGICNLQGVVFMKEEVSDPFQTIDQVLSDHANETPLVFVDFHAEATSEKVALGYFLDGRVSSVIGTHTHIQTADATILPEGTAYLTDLGMTGPENSVLGVAIDRAVARFSSGSKQRFVTAKGPGRMDCCKISVDSDTGRANSIVSFRLRP